MDQNQEPSLTNFFGNNTVASAVIIGAVLVGISIIVGAWMIKGGGEVTGSAPTQQAVGQGTTANAKVTDRADEPVLGNTNAKLTIYEFGDFQCPFCKQFFQQTLPDLKTKYIDTGKVKLVFRQFPLSQIHVNAEISAEAAECANRQGQFQAYHDILYTQGQADGTNLDEASLKKYATQIGLNMATFNQCLDNHETKAVVAADQALGNAVGVTGTPSFVINGQLIVGAQPTATFEQAIDAALKS